MLAVVFTQTRKPWEVLAPKAPWSAVALATAFCFGFHGGSFAAALQGASRREENSETPLFPLPGEREKGEGSWGEGSCPSEAVKKSIHPVILRPAFWAEESAVVCLALIELLDWCGQIAVNLLYDAQPQGFSLPAAVPVVGLLLSSQ